MAAVNVAANKPVRIIIQSDDVNPENNNIFFGKILGIRSLRREERVRGHAGNGSAVFVIKLNTGEEFTYPRYKLEVDRPGAVELVLGKPLW